MTHLFSAFPLSQTQSCYGYKVLQQDECVFRMFIFFFLFLEISRYTLSGLCKSSVGSRTSSLVACYKAGIEMFAVDNSIGILNNSSQIQKACIFLHVMGGSCVYERADLRVTSVC